MILESQTAGFRALLPEHYDYAFFDGEEPFESYKEISDFFPGPYFCYYKDNSMKNVRLAHEYVQEIIEDEGNFRALEMGCEVSPNTAIDLRCRALRCRDRFQSGRLFLAL